MRFMTISVEQLTGRLIPAVPVPFDRGRAVARNGPRALRGMDGRPTDRREWRSGPTRGGDFCLATDGDRVLAAWRGLSQPAAS